MKGMVIQMKTKARLLSMLLALSCLLTAFASAAPAGSGSGLNNFPDVKTYQNGQFTDVPAGSWFENSVKTVYQKGLMEGVGGGLFDPYKVIPWSQAVTLAARLHATYNGQEIPAAEGPWYAKYMSYAENAGILPSTCPEAAEVDNKPITRQELAGLFCNILSSEDLPNINDKSIPDIAQVSPEFTDSAKAMYAAGIFTGKEGSKFDPNGQAQRAEIATIMSRLLLPGTRVGQDSKANQAMVKQYGNFANGGWMVQGDGVVYCIGKETVEIGEKSRDVYSIVSRTADGTCKEIYSTEHNIKRLSIDSAGLLYFIDLGFGEDGKADMTALKSLNPNTLETKDLYKSSEPTKHSLDTYILYEDEIYIFEHDSTMEGIDDWKYTFGHLENGKLKSLFNAKYSLVSNAANSLHIFNGKAYLLYGTKQDGRFYDDAVWSVDLKTGKMEQVTDLVYSKLAAFNQAACWYVTTPDEGKSMVLNRINLLRPDVKETVMTFPQEFGTSIGNMYANGSKLYYHSTSAKKIWQISDSGEYTQVGTLPTPYFDNSEITSFGVLAQVLEYMSICIPGECVVTLPDGRTISYDEFMGKTAIYEGSGLYELTQVTDFEPSFAEDDISNCQTRMGLRADGGLVIESTAKNNNSDKRTILYYCLDLTGEGLDIHKNLHLIDEMSAGESRDYTIVVPKELLNGANPDNLEVGLYMLVS